MKVTDKQETGTLWIHSVSQEILDSVDDTEKKRQEAINEVIYTERDFVRDLEYLRDVSPDTSVDCADGSSGSSRCAHKTSSQQSRRTISFSRSSGISTAYSP